MGGLSDQEFKMLSDIHAQVNALGPQVQGTKEDVQYLRSNAKRIEIKVARLEERHGNLEGDVNSLGAKVRDHVGSSGIHRAPGDEFTSATIRWVWMAKVVGGISAALALVMVMIKLFGLG